MTQVPYQKKSSGIQERIIIKGNLEFTSPVIFQADDADGLTDFVILRDEIDQSPLLPGTSLAGALRSHLIKRLPQNSTNGLDHRCVEKLFGSNDQGTSLRSWLFVEDALGSDCGIEVRDGVKIDPVTETAAHQGKYDMELLAAGTSFDIEFEFRLPSKVEDQPRNLKILLYAALTALEYGKVRLGGKKTRGLGECVVKDWKVFRYRMDKKEDIIRWLKDDRTNPEKGSSLFEKLGFTEEPVIPADEVLRISANFAIDRTLIVRSYSTRQGSPDSTHIHNSADRPILPGTSIAGALRRQANRITALKLNSKNEADALINNLFGSEKADQQGRLKGSRLIVSESLISGKMFDIVQNRVKIDPFTGGSYPGALFNEKPQVSGVAQLDFEISKPTDAEVAVLLLLIRDLWEGLIPIGGESAIGRGRLKGMNGALYWMGNKFDLVCLDANDKMKIEPDDHFTEDWFTRSFQAVVNSNKGKDGKNVRD